MFGGKEYGEELGLDWYDVSARNYDPAIGRWFVVDALADAEGQVHSSPYAYAMDNPVFYTDPDGNCPPGINCSGVWAIVKSQIFNDTGSGKKTLTLGLHNVKLPLADKVKFAPTGGSTTIANVGISMYNGVASTWNGAMEGENAGDMTADGIAEMGNTVRRMENGEGTIGDVEDLSAGLVMTALIGSKKGVSNNLKAKGSSTDFVVTSKGTAVPIPDGAKGPVNPNKGSGMTYQGGSGGKGMDKRTTGVRIMDPNSNQGRRVNYMNKIGQTVAPSTGRTISNKDPRGHLPLPIDPNM